MHTILKSAASIFGLWLIPLCYWQMVSHGSSLFMKVFVAFLVLMVVIGICAIRQRSSWVVFLWLPLMTFTALTTLLAAGAYLSEGGKSSGGPDAAPLEGVATLIVLIGVPALGFLTLLSYWVRPRVWPSLGMIILAGIHAMALWGCTTVVVKSPSATEKHRHLQDSGSKSANTPLVDNVYGDRNLICSCISVEEAAQ